MLLVNDVSCVRAGKKIFKNINFKIRKGGILQIVANNGVGKTSLLRLLCDLLPVDSGIVTWKYFVQNKIYIGNKQSLYENLTSEENLDLYLSLTKNNKKITVKDALSYFSINVGDATCRELSTGQRQRILLSKLLLIESNVWFLDEPFLFLDKDGIILTKKLIFDFLRSDNMVVITTHAVLTDLLSKSVIVYL